VTSGILGILYCIIIQVVLFSITWRSQSLTLWHQISLKSLHSWFLLLLMYLCPSAQSRSCVSIWVQIW